MEARRRRPGGQGARQGIGKYAEQRALQKEAAARSGRRKEAAAKEAASASSAASASAEGERRFANSRARKVQQGRQVQVPPREGGRRPEDGDAADAAEAFDVIAKMPGDVAAHHTRLGVAGACSMAACCSALAVAVATKRLGREALPALWRRRRRHRRRVEQRGAHRAARVLCERVAPRVGARRRRAGRARPRRDDVGRHRRRARLLNHEGKMLRLWEVRSGRRPARRRSRTRCSAATSASSARKTATMRPGRDGRRRRRRRGPRTFWIWSRRSTGRSMWAVRTARHLERAGGKRCAAWWCSRARRAGADRGGAGAGAGGTADLLAALLDEAAGGRRRRQRRRARPVHTAGGAGGDGERVSRRPDQGERCEP